jgi:hypothetical protein
MEVAASPFSPVTYRNFPTTFLLSMIPRKNTNSANLTREFLADPKGIYEFFPLPSRFPRTTELNYGQVSKGCVE